MLIASSASSGQVRYWSAEAVHARWIGRGAATLGLEGNPSLPAGQSALVAVLEGRQPRPPLPAEMLANPAGTGADGTGSRTVDRRPGDFLTSRPGARRRQGWDLVFAAPKSVSVLAAALPHDEQRALVGPYRRAVDDAMSLLEERGAFARFRSQEVRVLGIVAAGFEHRTNAAGAPHLHTHVALSNLGHLGDTTWGCLVGPRAREWADAVAGCFHLSLRSRLREAGFDFRWSLNKHGGADIDDPALAGPGGTRRGSPTGRGLEVLAEGMRSGNGGRRAARVALGRTRARTPVPAGGPSAQNPSGAKTGPLEPIGPAEATACLARARFPALTPAPPPDRHRLREILAERSSHWSEPDVWAALARACPSGLAREAAAPLAKEWAGISRADKGLLPEDAYVLDNAARPPRPDLVRSHVASVELDQLGIAGSTRIAAEELLARNETVSVLGPADWLTQARVIDAARAAWQAAGATVHVASPCPERWRPLTSLQPPAGAALGETSPSNVLVVDSADRLGPGALAQLVTDTVQNNGRLVLIAGGTQHWAPRARAEALDQLLRTAGVAVVARGDLQMAPEPISEQAGVVEVPGINVRGTFRGDLAMRRLVEQHLRMGTLMVAFGREEAVALNGLAAEGWRRTRLAVPASRGASAGESGGFLVGDKVIALRRLGTVPGATFGEVLQTGPEGITVRWQDRGNRRYGVSQVMPTQRALLGLAYAVTAPYLRSLPRTTQVLVLGDPYALGPHYPQVQGAWTALAGPGQPAVGISGQRLRTRSAVAQLAAGWPDERMLCNVGTRPISRNRRRPWVARVAEEALDRHYGLQAVRDRQRARRPDLGLGEPGPQHRPPSGRQPGPG